MGQIYSQESGWRFHLRLTSLEQIVDALRSNAQLLTVFRKAVFIDISKGFIPNCILPLRVVDALLRRVETSSSLIFECSTPPKDDPSSQGTGEMHVGKLRCCSTYCVAEVVSVVACIILVAKHLRTWSYLHGPGGERFAMT